MVFFLAIIVRAFIVTNSTTLILTGVIIGTLLTLLAMWLTTKITKSKIARYNNTELQQNQPQRTKRRPLYYFIGTSSGFLGAVIARFMFENVLPEGIGNTLGFIFVFASIIYFILVFFISMHLYDIYLIRKYNLAHLKV